MLAIIDLVNLHCSFIKSDSCILSYLFLYSVMILCVPRVLVVIRHVTLFIGTGETKATTTGNII